MPDPRFYEAKGPLGLDDLARLIGARRERGGADLPIAGVAPLADAGAGDLVFLAGRSHVQALVECRATACVVAEADQALAPASMAILVSPVPQAAFARAAAALFQLRPHGAGSAIDPTARFEEGVEIDAGAVVGPQARIGAGTTIGPGATIGPGVTLGRGCRIGARAVIGCALLGDRVSVLAGAVIGEAGFGVAVSERGLVDMPQLGRVILQDDVTVGANSCIDRGALSDTVVGERSKIDNLVQIAHNVVIGRDCVMAAMTGISGSVVIGDGCQFGGRAGVTDHLTIGAGARIAAASGVMRDVPAGEAWGGVPARPIRQWLRETAAAARLARRGEGR